MAAPPGGQFTYQGRRSAVLDMRRSTHDGAVAFRGQYSVFRCERSLFIYVTNSYETNTAIFLMSKESKVHSIYIVDSYTKYSNYMKI